MSPFWDAVGRAALGLPGTAVPRPRSIFETDAGERPAADIAAADSEVEVESKPQTPAEVIQPKSSSQAPEVSTRAVDERRVAAVPDEPSEDHRQLEPLPDDRRFVEASHAVELASGQRPVEEPSVSRTIERIEVHRFETTHVQTDSVATQNAEERPSPVRLEAASRPASSDSASVEPEPVVQAGASSDSATPPINVVAEPRVVAASTTPDEPGPPLVIEIDRIDIRIESQAPVPPPVSRRRDAARGPSLDHYLETRSGASR